MVAGDILDEELIMLHGGIRDAVKSIDDPNTMLAALELSFIALRLEEVMGEDEIELSDSRRTSMFYICRTIVKESCRVHLSVSDLMNKYGSLILKRLLIDLTTTKYEGDGKKFNINDLVPLLMELKGKNLQEYLPLLSCFHLEPADPSLTAAVLKFTQSYITDEKRGEEKIEDESLVALLQRVYQDCLSLAVSEHCAEDFFTLLDVVSPTVKAAFLASLTDGDQEEATNPELTLRLIRSCLEGDQAESMKDRHLPLHQHLMNQKCFSNYSAEVVDITRLIARRCKRNLILSCLQGIIKNKWPLSCLSATMEENAISVFCESRGKTLENIHNAMKVVVGDGEIKDISILFKLIVKLIYAKLSGSASMSCDDVISFLLSHLERSAAEPKKVGTIFSFPSFPRSFHSPSFPCSL